MMGIVAMALAFAPKAAAGWSANNSGINYWITPNWVENGKDNVTVGGTVYNVDDITYGYTKTQYFYVNMRNDNYPGMNLVLSVNGIISGPDKTGDWKNTDGWLGWAIWDNATGAWSGGTSSNAYVSWQFSSSYKNGSVLVQGLDNAEYVTVRLAFNFGNQTHYVSADYFSDFVRVQLALTNLDNAEVYWTPELYWYVYKFGLENTFITTMADTQVVDSLPNTNFGDNVHVTVTAGGNAGFFKFSLNALPANWGVQRAWLRYYVDDSAVGGQQMYTTQTTWVENVITFNNWATEGAAQDPVADLGAWPATANSWNTFDVSQAVRDNVAAGKQYISFVFFNAGGITHIRSKENSGGLYASYLIIETIHMETGLPPTFAVNSVAEAGSLLTLHSWLLEGRIDAMNDDNHASFMFITYDAGGHELGMYPYGMMSSVGTFALTTGYSYFEDTQYYLRIQCFGINTQTLTFTDYYSVRFHENVNVPPGGAHGPCTLTTTDVTGISESGATIHYSGSIGDNNRLAVMFDIGENADNLDNYMTPSSKDWGGATGSISGTYVYVGLDNGVVYYVRVRGVDMDLNIINGGWMTFTTLVSPPPPLLPPSQDTGRINITSFADWVGNALFGGVTKSDGSSTAHDAGGLFLSAIIIICILAGLAHIRVPQLGIVGVLIVLVGLMTAIAWVPLWIGMVIGLGFSLLMAQKVVKAVR
jgi:hypothetical protein